MVFSSPADAKFVLREGKLLEGVLRAFNPGRGLVPQSVGVMRIDPAIHAHLEWIGFVQPTGLVVSAHALVRAGAILDRRDVDGQQRLGACVEERIFDPKEGSVPHLPDFRRRDVDLRKNDYSTRSADCTLHNWVTLASAGNSE